eukprot:COSAG05_NODE_15549_length_366_cov_52.052434_1_plen_21_part_10
MNVVRLLLPAIHTGQKNRSGA